MYKMFSVYLYRDILTIYNWSLVSDFERLFVDFDKYVYYNFLGEELYFYGYGGIGRFF